MTEQFVFLGFRWAPCGPPPAGWGHSPQTDQITAPCNVSGCVTGRDWFADVVEYTMRTPGASHRFGCSPLFCNYMAHLIWVNQHCLLPDLATARQVAHLFAQDPPEPGPYMIVEVWAKEKQP